MGDKSQHAFAKKKVEVGECIMKFVRMVSLRYEDLGTGNASADCYLASFDLSLIPIC